MENKWAIILGCSTGHGAAIAKQLATEGYGIIGFHLDRGSIKKRRRPPSRGNSLFEQ